VIRRLVLGLVVVACAGALFYNVRRFSLSDIVVLLSGTPHERYALDLKFRGLDDTADGRRWITSARESLLRPRAAALPAIDPTPLDVDAVAYEFHLRRGQKYVATVRGGDRVFVDVFRREGDHLEHVRSAPRDTAELEVEISADADYLVRIQPALDAATGAVLSQTVQPSLAMPVEGAKRSSIQSGFGAARDAGARLHQGVDIFAPRGTPVLAAADGIVTSVGVNGLGGNVVWQARPLQRESLYYAHLDTQLVKTGSYVRRGEVLGTVGNTGNARGGPAHLHFGIYASGGAVDPLPYLASPLQPPKHSLMDHRRTAAR
jgi:murein DD-endopeptidase MepM/ murein hydrolase activator NlpD